MARSESVRRVEGARRFRSTPPPIGAVFDRGCNAMQSDLSLLAVPPDGFFVRVLADAYNHVIERAIRAGTSNGGFTEWRPRAPQSTLPRVVRLQARHVRPGLF